MSETTYPEFPSEGSDDSVTDDPEVPEEAEPETTEGEEAAPEEDTPANDVYSVQQLGTDPTKSSQSGDESGLDLDEVVRQVFEGKWGNGQEQRNRLAAAGYDHVEVHQAVVDRMNANRHI